MRRARSAWERFANTQRNMNPGSQGGRTPLIAPEPRPLLEPKVYGVDSYDPLDPWGSVGDAPLFGNGWHGIYTDLAAAAGPSGPVFEFGIEDGGAGFRTTGWSLIADAADLASYAQMRVSDDGSGQFEMFPAGSGAGHLTWSLDTLASLDLGVSDDGDAVKLDAGGDNAVVSLEDGSGQTLKLVCDGNVSYIELDHSATDPSAAPTAGVRLYAKQSGTKTSLYALFDSGAAQLIAAEP